MPNSGLLKLGQSITLALCNWRFDMLRGFSWKEILACVVKYRKFSPKFSCCLVSCFRRFISVVEAVCELDQSWFRGLWAVTIVAEHHLSSDSCRGPSLTLSISVVCYFVLNDRKIFIYV